MQEDPNIAEYRLDELGEGISKGTFDASWKGKLERFLESKYFFWVVILLVAITSFCFGRVSKIETGREPVRVTNSSKTLDPSLPNPLYLKEGTEQQSGVPEVKGVTAQTVVGSKSGTKYHLPTCPGAKQISEKNKIVFNSIEEARAKGYTPASNCKGLK